MRHVEILIGEKLGLRRLRKGRINHLLQMIANVTVP